MMRLLKVYSIGAVILLLTSGVALAQATAELNGRVNDESGAVRPGVTITATQIDTAFTRTVVTDGSGSYAMPNLSRTSLSAGCACGPPSETTSHRSG